MEKTFKNKKEEIEYLKREINFFKEFFFFINKIIYKYILVPFSILYFILYIITHNHIYFIFLCVLIIYPIAGFIINLILLLIPFTRNIFFDFFINEIDNKNIIKFKETRKLIITTILLSGFISSVFIFVYCLNEKFIIPFFNYLKNKIVINFLNNSEKTFNKFIEKIM